MERVCVMIDLGWDLGEGGGAAGGVEVILLLI